MKTKLKITIAQINSIVGDIEGNAEQIIAAALYARDKQCADIIVFPEMVLTGYMPQDLLFCAELHNQIKAAIKKIQTEVKKIYIIFGAPTLEKITKKNQLINSAISTYSSLAKNNKKNQIVNSALVIYNNKTLASYHKQSLLNNSILNEDRYFTAGDKNCILTIENTKIAITIGADLHDAKIMQQIKKAKAKIIINIDASPFYINKHKILTREVQKQAKANQAAIIYVNGIGGQDNLVFDGGSLVVDEQGKVIQRLDFFTQDLVLLDFAATSKQRSKERLMSAFLRSNPENALKSPDTGAFKNTPRNDEAKQTGKAVTNKYSAEELIYSALVLGVRDYTEKNNFAGIILGLSGGIDSALSLAIAVDALGKEKVEALYLPSQYSSDLSAKLAQEEADTLGIKFTSIPIQPLFETCINTLDKDLFSQNSNTNIAKQNLQARCRAIILMAHSNTKNLLLLATGNKSEVAAGYATLYGDTAGGFCALSDISKTLVYKLAKYRNTISPVIPKEAITRAPSAELAPGQKDIDSLPPYPILDEIIERYIEHGQTAKTIIATGIAQKTVKKVIDMIKSSEYKRWQSAPGIKITSKTFGIERKHPITSTYKDY